MGLQHSISGGINVASFPAETTRCLHWMSLPASLRGLVQGLGRGEPRLGA